MKVLKGKVVGTKMAKTATVAVERIVIHPVYRKRYKRIRKYHVHDEIGVKVGQEVKFAASRPYSKLKKWKVIEAVGGEKNIKSIRGIKGKPNKKVVKPNSKKKGNKK